MKERKERCETCYFWVLWTDSAIDKAACPGCKLHGQCKRYPPTQLASDEQPRPEMTEDDWCGEWKPRRKSDA